MNFTSNIAVAGLNTMRVTQKAKQWVSTCNTFYTSKVCHCTKVIMQAVCSLLIGDNCISTAASRNFGISQIHNTFGILSAA